MPLISVLTACCRPVPAQLLEAYQSLCRQALPAGWEWEWVIQEDGRTGSAGEILPQDDRITLGFGRPGGVAITRNLGLSRADGELVRNLDQDDVLTTGALFRDVAALADSGIGWATSRARDVYPDGSMKDFPDSPPTGPLAPGTVLRYWREHDYRLPVHPTTLCIRRSLVTALGGWMAVPGSDDTGLLLAASVVSTGYFIGEVGLLYRRWPGQESAGEAHNEPIERRARMKLIDERATNLARIWHR